MFRPSIKDPSGNEYFVNDNVIISTIDYVRNVKLLSFLENKLEYCLTDNHKQIGYIAYDRIIDIEPLETTKEKIKHLLKILEECNDYGNCFDCPRFNNDDNNPVCLIINSNASQLKYLNDIFDLFKRFMEDNKCII